MTSDLKHLLILWWSLLIWIKSLGEMIDKQKTSIKKNNNKKKQDFVLLIPNLDIIYMYKKDAFRTKKKHCTTTYKIWEHKGQSTVSMKRFTRSLESSQDMPFWNTLMAGLCSIQIHVLTTDRRTMNWAFTLLTEMRVRGSVGTMETMDESKVSTMPGLHQLL